MSINKQFPRIVNYQNIRHLLRSGDIIGFRGHFLGSKIIMLGSGGELSHIGIVLKTRYDKQIGDTVVEMIEANHDSAYPDLDGVVVSRVSDRIPFYYGDVFVLRLSDKARAHFDEDKFLAFLGHEKGKPYDMDTRWKSAVDWLDEWGISNNPEDIQQYFCSELVAAAYKAAGLLPNVNPSEIDPADIVKWNIYQPEYYQVKCFNYEAIALPNYNSIEVF
jgi:hypothetical protein